MAKVLRTKIRGKNKELPLTKIFWTGIDEDSDKTCQITLTNNYGGQSLGLLTQMADVAKADFPNAGLCADSFNAVVLGGDSRKHMWGIEFKIPVNTKIPSSYKRTNPEPIIAGGL